MIRLSKKEDYAIILVNKLAQSFNKRLVPLSEISREYKISLLFLRNLAYVLKNAGLIKAVEGKNGGYFLTQAPDDLRVGKILSVFSKDPMLECCPSGIGNRGKCLKENVCEPGFIWRKLNKQFLNKIYNLSLKEFFSL